MRKGFAQLLLLIPVFVLLVSTAVFFYYNQSKSSKTQVSNIVSQSPSVATTTQNSNSIKNKDNLTTLDTFPDFSKFPIIPKTTFDTSSWVSYENKQAGITFKYPTEWGKPQSTYRQGGGECGWLFLVTFQNSQFQVGGTSVDFCEGRDARITDFNGFRKPDNKNNPPFWETPQKVCDNFLALECNVDNVHVKVLTGASCNTFEMLHYTDKLMLVNRPGKTISGLILGGNYSLINYTTKGGYSLFCAPYGSTTYYYPYPYRNTNNPYVGPENIEYVKAFNNALMQRKLDEKTMKNLDEYDQVFSTFEEL